MSNGRIINIFANQNRLSQQIRQQLRNKLEQAGFTVPAEYSSAAELIVSIGGDGAFLKTLHRLNFPKTPFLGINTGHLGFFQELQPGDIDYFLTWYQEGRYRTQVMKTVLAEVTVADKVWKYVGLNEIVIRSGRSQAVHLDISIGKNFIERFSGDGLLVCTAAGSTAYNYALGGSIIDPRLSLLQITPIAPMNTTAFRSFTSSLAVPPDLPIKIQPEPGRWQSLLVVADNNSYSYPKIDEVNLGYSPYEVRLLRFENYDFWSKVKSKFL